MTTESVAFAASASVTCTLASLATSSSLVAGRQSDQIDNSTNLYTDYLVSAMVTVGTTPTAGTQIELWVIPEKTDSAYPDVFTGAGDANKTVTTREILAQSGRLAKVWDVLATTSNVAFDSGYVSVRSLLGYVPRKFVLFVVHNTGVNLNATGGNHVLTQKGTYRTYA